MNKLKRFLIAGLAFCAAGCAAAGIAACTNDSDYVNFRKPANYVEPGDVDTDFDGNYVITVATAGGMRINEVKVTIDIGTEVLTLKSIGKGEINFKAEPGEYEIVVDETTLPTGYYIGNEKFKTSATSAEATVTVRSKVMPTTAVSSYRYSLGDVMYDFGYTDNNGERQVLSEILAEDSQYKAVVLNFWYIACSPCVVEFPAIQAAYENYKDRIKVIAVSTSDSQSAIDKFRNENGYTFDMIQDLSNLTNLFSVSATPSTIIIDRYGVFVYYSEGKEVDSRAWSSKFAYYVSDNYVQDPGDDESDPGDNPGGSSSEIIIPDIEEGDYSKYPAMLNGEGTQNKVLEYYGASTENDKKYNWPWLPEVDNSLGLTYVKTTNSTYGNSFSILTVTISLEAGDYISYDYFTSTEATNDILYVLVNGEIVAEHSGESKDNSNSNAYGWITKRAVYTANRNRTISLSFCYLKDEMEDGGDDYVAISNITINNVKEAEDAIDMRMYACSGDVDSSGYKYTEYTEVYFNEQDNYYHVKYGDNSDAILYLDFINTTAWSDLHIGGLTFRPINYDVDQLASLYFLIYWDYTNWRDSSSSLTLTIGGSEAERLTETYINAYYMNLFSSNALIPVTKDLKELTETFLKEYCRIENIDFHENMWLEFCYYFEHYGNAHPEGEDCNSTSDSTMGMSFINTYTAVLGDNTIDVWNAHTMDGGGMLAKFIPEVSGVYKFASFDSQMGDDPALVLYDSQQRMISYYDNLVCYDLFLRPSPEDFEGYAYLEAGKEYYLRVSKGYQLTGVVNYSIEYIGDSYDELRVATTGDGMWSYDSDLGLSMTFYLAIDVYLYSVDNNYYHIDQNGDRGSVVYIDFIHPNFFEANDHSLYWIVDQGLFNFADYGGPDYTNKMIEYYNMAIDKDEDDETYGMIEASKELVNIVTTFIELINGEKPESKYWLSFATYYEHYGK